MRICPRSRLTEIQPKEIKDDTFSTRMALLHRQVRMLKGEKFGFNLMSFKSFSCVGAARSPLAVLKGPWDDSGVDLADEPVDILVNGTHCPGEVVVVNENFEFRSTILSVLRKDSEAERLKATA